MRNNGSSMAYPFPATGADTMAVGELIRDKKP
jgi:hypothetical protein